ncbi:EutP/PduV family microcompartment system protein [Parendozoicomonas haliclonae]|uniref:Propanediol utilization protein PduV n=1 Tax=Parendozoicomonas haliclonae TaxID=1960125 RepID=A0A1X7AM00_9GAMM|nr:EutP/PduV family microcompartment system protein [Parendozoicomonas haliclonae]SMA48790.1 Propanediol utilization protein PduV [Parendozoicomonas haliclonae]
MSAAEVLTEEQMHDFVPAPLGRRLMLVGTTGSGKTTLMQALLGEELKYIKTQAMDYRGKILDTPGEFVEMPRFYNALTVSSADYEVVALVHDSSRQVNCFPPNFNALFNNRDVIGVITKVDVEKSGLSFSRRMLENAGVKRIFEISSVSGKGMQELMDYLS